MITFMPFNSFQKSAECLDKARLCNQPEEVLDIFAAITNPDLDSQPGKWYGVAPVDHMWRGFEVALLHYGKAIITEMENRQFKVDEVYHLMFDDIPPLVHYPPFMSDIRFHDSHKLALMFKDYGWYYDLFGKRIAKPSRMPRYFWPIMQKQWKLMYASEFYRETYMKVDFFKDKPWGYQDVSYWE